MMNVEGYEPLRDALQEAYDQSARGKGVQRHANGRDFDRQPIMEIGRMVGPGFQLGQAMKKIQEASGMINRAEGGAAIRELLGAIVYAAAAINLVREMEPPAGALTDAEMSVLLQNIEPTPTPFRQGTTPTQLPGITDDPMRAQGKSWPARLWRTPGDGVQGS